MSWTTIALLGLPWVILAGYGIAVLLSAPRRAGPTGFFGGRSRAGDMPGIILLGASAAISWVMAKSVNNAMNLAADFGWIGGVAYGAYWLAFIVVGITVATSPAPAQARAPEALVLAQAPALAKALVLALQPLTQTLTLTLPSSLP